MYIRFNKSTRNYGGYENYFFDSTHFLKRKYFLKLIILNLVFCGEIGGVIFFMEVTLESIDNFHSAFTKA